MPTSTARFLFRWRHFRTLWRNSWRPTEVYSPLLFTVTWIWKNPSVDTREREYSGDSKNYIYFFILFLPHALPAFISKTLPLN